MRQILAFVVFAVLLTAFAPAAKADTFVWKDDVNDYTISYPDVWRIQTDDDVYTRLRIAGPLIEDRATCRMQVQKDGRLKVYPKYLLDRAVSETLNRDFWEKEVSQFNNAKIESFYDPASMGGKGDATAVNVTFDQETGNGVERMRGIMLASIYGPNRYEITCSSTQNMYERYAGLFLSIIDSVELESRYHIFPTGYYRSFLMDPKLVLPRQKPGTTDVKEGNFFWADKYHH